MLWAIGAWLASGLIGGLWAKRKGHIYGDSLPTIQDDRDDIGFTGHEASPYFAAMLSGPFALYNAWKQQRHSK